MDLYSQMGEELRSLFKDLFDPSHARVIRQKMARILDVASQIGGRVKEEAEQLNADIVKYLDKPSDPRLAIILKAHASRLEQETREL